MKSAADASSSRAPSPSCVDTLVTPAAEGPGSQIGPYRLLEVIGEGGFGTVYLAEQTAPIQRKVALKIIKLGMDTKAVIARFEAERQALAMMDHPNIARVLDAGATQTGRPYFVMEWVRGVPITEFCDGQRLSIRDRLGLLVSVCHAVQHAHQKGIIHRDIKPSNVLVMFDADQAVPKVIDFGIAKAMHARLTEKTVHTEFRQIVGTLEYMSPEQAEHSGLDVDTRADIYSLGVLAYELLTGVTPFDSAALRSTPITQVPRMLLEQEPLRPSTRIAAASRRQRAAPAPPARASTEEIARRRRADPASLRRALRGELDWIVMKCLEKDRTRRYASTHELALDLQRYLNHEVVLAGAPSRAYRLRKFVQRHRLGLAAGAGTALALMAGLVMASYGLIQARKEAERAHTQAARAEAVSAFLRNMLLAVDPSNARARDTSLLREILADAAGKVGSSFGAMPDVEASLRELIGHVYLDIGRPDEAAAQLGAAVALRERMFGAGSPQGIEARRLLADAHGAQGRRTEAELAYRAILENATQAWGADDPRVAQILFRLAGACQEQGRLDEATRLYDQTLDIQRRRLPRDHGDTLRTQTAKANLLLQRGARDEALALMEYVLPALQRTTGEDSPSAIRAMDVLAGIYAETGRDDQAESLYKRVVELRQKVLGSEHVTTLESIGRLSNFYMDRNRLAEAEPLLKQRLEIGRKRYGERNDRVLMAMGDLADLYRLQKRYEEAEKLFLEAMRLWRDTQGAANANTLITQSGLVSVYAQQRRWEDAAREAAALVSTARKSALAQHWYLGSYLMQLGTAERELGQYAQAEQHLLEAKAILSKTFGAEHEPMRTVAAALAKLYTEWRRPGESPASAPSTRGTP